MSWDFTQVCKEAAEEEVQVDISISCLHSYSWRYCLCITTSIYSHYYCYNKEIFLCSLPMWSVQIVFIFLLILYGQVWLYILYYFHLTTYNMYLYLCMIENRFCEQLTGCFINDTVVSAPLHSTTFPLNLHWLHCDHCHPLLRHDLPIIVRVSHWHDSVHFILAHITHPNRFQQSLKLNT